MKSKKKQLLTSIFWFSLSTSSLAEDGNNSSVPEQSQKPGTQTDTSSQETLQTDQSQPSDKEASSTVKIERAVMPFTQWVEDKVQNISIVKPTGYGEKNQSRESTGVTLREAIEIAQKKYKGTVLSADKITRNSTHYYRIKILSEGGVVKLIEVDGKHSPSENRE